jgi:hypothetical protein
MSDNANATILVTLPKPYLYILRKMAAEQTFKNPGKKKSAAGLVREIICQHLDTLDPEIKTRLTSEITPMGSE